MSAQAQKAIRTPEVADQAGAGVAPSQTIPSEPSKGAKAEQQQVETPVSGAGSYLFLLLTILTLVLLGVAYGNYKLNPFIYQQPAMAQIARSLNDGQNFALYDLNFDIRGVRREQIRLLTKTPEVMILGASHWQEAHAGLMPGVDFFNGHVHRDYFHDPMAMTELLLRYNRLPETLVISVRDATFTQPAQRNDYLWLPFTPESREMEQRLGLPDRPWLDDFVLQPILDRFSLHGLLTSALRLVEVDEVPGPTTAESSAQMDLFMADGSIRWSEEHLAAFTPKYVRERALELAEQAMAHPPGIDVAAVDYFRRTLDVLRDRGVSVVLIHPPFNPTYYDAITGSFYETRLGEVELVTRKLAEKIGASVVGSFNPRKIGCTVEMYIDAEHSRPECLQKLLAQVPVSGSASSLREQ